jgi:hypothetical protein
LDCFPLGSSMINNLILLLYCHARLCGIWLLGICSQILLLIAHCCIACPALNHFMRPLGTGYTSSILLSCYFIVFGLPPLCDTILLSPAEYCQCATCNLILPRCAIRSYYRLCRNAPLPVCAYICTFTHFSCHQPHTFTQPENLFPCSVVDLHLLHLGGGEALRWRRVPP